MFSKATPTERQGILGDTFSPTSEQQPQEALSHLLDGLVQRCATDSLAFMQATADAEAREQIYHLPDKLAALRGPLLCWANAFFATTGRRANPMLRAAFLCSAAPKEAAAFHASLPGQTTQALGAPLFTHTLLSEGVLGDRRPSTAVAASKQRPWGMVLTAATAMAVVMLPIASYVHNAGDLWQAQRVVSQLAPGANAAGPGPQDARLAAPDTLDDMLRAQQTLQTAAAQASYLSTRTGMSQSAMLAQKMQQLYGQTLRDRVVAPLLDSDTQRMQTLLQHFGVKAEDVGEEAVPGGLAAAPAEQDFVVAQAYLRMHLLCTNDASTARLSDPQEGAWLTSQLARRWGKAVGEGQDDATIERLSHHVNTFVEAMRADAGYRLTRRADMVDATRRMLARAPAQVAVLAQLTVNTDTYALGLPQLLGDNQVPLLSDTHVPGGYTKDGWDNVVKARLAQPDPWLEGTWVLGAKQTAMVHDFVESTGPDALETAYWRRYNETWHTFVASLRLAGNAAGKEDDAAVYKTTLQRLQETYPAAYSRLNQGIQTNLAPAKGHVDIAKTSQAEP